MRWRFSRAVLATLLSALLVAPSVPLAAGSLPVDLNPKTLGRKPLVVPDTGLSEDERVVHLLNRIGFGPRRGDVERIKEIGVAAYIEQQLHPETIGDTEIEARLAGLETLQMTTTQLLAAYDGPRGDGLPVPRASTPPGSAGTQPAAVRPDG
jgi:hypothetical protein